MFCLAAGELLIDKLPGVPNRTDVAPMVTRAVAGALVALAARPPGGGVGGRIFAVALGAAAAGAGTTVAFHLRRLANRRLGDGAMANLATGALEDAVAIACGRWLLT
jgi:uncharacterized membrane protein